MRIESVQQLNAAANNPDTLRMLNPKADYLDLAWVYSNGGVVLGCQGITGCCVFLPTVANTFEMHYLMGGYRGAKAAKACVDYVFEKLDASAIRGHTPKDNLSARIVNRYLGGAVTGACLDGLGRACLAYELTRDAWARQRA